RLGMIVDGTNVTVGSTPGKPEAFEVNEKYQRNGTHAEAVNRSNDVRIPLRRGEGEAACTLEVRAFNDGVGFRFVVPGPDKSRVPEEATKFTPPPGSTVWYHDLEGHYEAVHTKKAVGEAPARQWAAPPLTIRLPDRLGAAAIT